MTDQQVQGLASAGCEEDALVTLAGTVIGITTALLWSTSWPQWLPRSWPQWCSTKVGAKTDAAGKLSKVEVAKVSEGVPSQNFMAPAKLWDAGHRRSPEHRAEHHAEPDQRPRAQAHEPRLRRVLRAAGPRADDRPGLGRAR